MVLNKSTKQNNNNKYIYNNIIVKKGDFVWKRFFSIKDPKQIFFWKNKKYVWDPLLSFLKNFKPKSKLSKIPKSVFFENSKYIFIDEGTIIEPNVFIKGPCYIGKNSVIRHGAYIREHTIIGDETIIGHGSEIKHSIILNKARISHFSYVADSILGNEVNLGAGVKCANLRLDRKEIIINGIKTGFQKMGAIIGDNSQIGCNAVLNPGTILFKNSICYPLTSVSGVKRTNIQIKL